MICSFFCSGGGYGGGRFAPAGYGGAASVGYRSGAYGGGMGGTGAPAGYGYPSPQAINPQGYYGGAGMGAVQGGYPGYAGAQGAPNAYGESSLVPALLSLFSQCLMILSCFYVSTRRELRWPQRGGGWRLRTARSPAGTAQQG